MPGQSIGGQGVAGACERLYLRPSGEAAGCPEPRLGHCWSAHPVSAPGPRAPGSQGPLGVMAERCDLKWPAWTSAPSQASPGRERGERSCQTPGSFTAAPDSNQSWRWEVSGDTYRGFGFRGLGLLQPGFAGVQV